MLIFKTTPNQYVYTDNEHCFCFSLPDIQVCRLERLESMKNSFEKGREKCKIFSGSFEINKILKFEVTL